jgi:hypothetical protein
LIIGIFATGLAYLLVSALTGQFYPVSNVPWYTLSFNAAVALLIVSSAFIDKFFISMLIFIRGIAVVCVWMMALLFILSIIDTVIHFSAWAPDWYPAGLGSLGALLIGILGFFIGKGIDKAFVSVINKQV